MFGLNLHTQKLFLLLSYQIIYNITTKDSGGTMYILLYYNIRAIFHKHYNIRNIFRWSASS